MVMPQQEAPFYLESPRRRARPFLKWAGGKTRLLPLLRHAIPKQPFRRYFEPFVGGGAVFFDLAPENVVLSDSNPELILCYEIVRDATDQLISELSDYQVNEEEFYRIRGLQPADLSRVQRAARFIYLNKTCYNGVYRVNKNGQFNTPFGHYKSVSLVDKNNLLLASTALKSTVLFCQDYKVVIESAQEGDFIYFDPPYMPVSKNSDFKRYTKEFFYEEDHTYLAQVFRLLSDRGCFVLLSNSFHEKIADLYSDFFQLKVHVPRFVNCKGEGRGNVPELLISNYPVVGGGVR